LAEKRDALIEFGRDLREVRRRWRTVAIKELSRDWQRRTVAARHP
jgi:hypothetical protein